MSIRKIQREGGFTWGFNHRSSFAFAVYQTTDTGEKLVGLFQWLTDAKLFADGQQTLFTSLV